MKDKNPQITCKDVNIGDGDKRIKTEGGQHHTAQGIHPH